MWRSKAIASLAKTVSTLAVLSVGGMVVSPISAQQSETTPPPDAATAQTQLSTKRVETPDKVPAQATTSQQRLDAARAEAERRAQIEAQRKAEAEAMAREEAEKQKAKEEKRPPDPLQEKIRRSERKAIFTPRSYTNEEPEDELSPTQLLILDLLSRDSRPREK